MGVSIEEYKKMIGNCGTDMKNPCRQLTGKISHGIGENFECQVENICRKKHRINNKNCRRSK